MYDLPPPYLHTGIQTQEQYQDALTRVSPMFDQDFSPNSPQGQLFDQLVDLIMAWERRTLF